MDATVTPEFLRFLDFRIFRWELPLECRCVHPTSGEIPVPLIVALPERYRTTASSVTEGGVR